MENYEMLWIIVTASATMVLSSLLGYKKILYVHQLGIRNLSITGAIGVTICTIMIFLSHIELMSEDIGAAIITNVYASVTGFFGGASFHQYRTKKTSGDILYSHRSFLSDHASVIIALIIILCGMYRTSIFTELAITPIRVSSGLSLIGFGLWGLTLRLVPEFRSNGIILLDFKIPWTDFLNYSWFLEDVIEVEYNLNDTIKYFKTSIPLEDQRIVEDLLRAKMMEKVSENGLKIN